jgi:hypothetical protein
MIRRRSGVQLPEIRQRAHVIFLLKIRKAEVELNFTQLRTYAESPPVDLDGFPVAMGLGIENPQVRQCADIARIGCENFVETRFCCRVVAGIQRLHGGIKCPPRCVRRCTNCSEQGR